MTAGNGPRWPYRPPATDDLLVRMSDARVGPGGNGGLGPDAYRALFEHSIDGVLLTSPDGRIFAANPAACDMLRMTEGDICARGRRGVMAPGDRRWAEAVAERERTGRLRAELEMRRGDGTVFLADVSSAVFEGPNGEPRTCVIFRDVTDRHRNEESLRAVNEMTVSLLAGEPIVDILTMTAGFARRLVAAAAAWVVTRPTGADTIVVNAQDAPGAPDLVGMEFALPDTLAGAAIKAGAPITVADLSTDPRATPTAQELGYGPTLLVPLAHGDRKFGTLIVSATRETPPFGPGDLDVVQMFARSAALALAFAAARTEVDRLGLVEERERIGRNLHDSVIQRLFATGIRLQSLSGQAEGRVAEHIADAVDELDDVIREVRATIFDLRAPVTVDEGP